jgi:hypothetical protein
LEEGEEVTMDRAERICFICGLVLIGVVVAFIAINFMVVAGWIRVADCLFWK